MDSEILMQRDNTMQVKFTVKYSSYDAETSKNLAIYSKVLLGARVIMDYNGEYLLTFVR